MPDPKLLAAMEEIKVVLHKHDIAAVVILSSQTHVEYLHEISPSWSCARLEHLPDGGYGMRIKALRKDYPSVEAQKQMLQDTTSLILGNIDALTHTRDQYIKIAVMLGQVLQIEHMSKHESEPQRGYSVDLNGPSITCYTCGRTSHNPNDLREKYCGFCHTWHEK